MIALLFVTLFSLLFLVIIEQEDIITDLKGEKERERNKGVLPMRCVFPA